ncbi:MAG: NAD(P)-dependent oxidoreductase [Saprospiraceae bacterium]|nr:NAD(P)-dependent oxidoreductase [Saprospiraceae bacterium]
MRILVIGSNSFIGKHLVKVLTAEKEYLVFGLGRSKNFHSYIKNYTFHFANLLNSDWINLFKNDFDVLIYLSQSDQYRNFPEGAKDMLDINVNALLTAAQFAKDKKVRQFIYFSTGNVYATANSMISENYKCNPNTFYGASKFTGEQVLQQFKDFFQVCILRVFGVYGPGQTDKLIPNILHRLESRQEITLAGGKGIIFNPTYIEDMVEIITGIVSEKKVKNEGIFNISGDEVISLSDIVYGASKFFKINPIIKITNEEPITMLGSNKKIKDHLNILGHVSFKEGFHKTLISFGKENRQGN